MDHGRLASTGGSVDDSMMLSSHVSSLSERTGVGRVRATIKEHNDGD